MRHTIKLILGPKPLSLYDDTARPTYADFGLRPDLRPFDAIVPPVDLHALNKRSAYGKRSAPYGAAISARQDWSEPDQVNPALRNRILEHDILGHTVSTR